MSETYNPITGPHRNPPPKAPGAVVVVASQRGVELLARDRPPGAASRMPAAPAPLTHPSAEHLIDAGASALKGIWRSLAAGRREYFVVDVARHRMSDQFTIPTKEGSVHFIVALRCDVRISDPLGAVAEGVTDVRAYLATALEKRLARVARRYSAIDLATAQRDLQATMDTEIAGGIDPIVRIETVHLDVGLDVAARKLHREASEAGLHREAIRARGKVNEEARAVEMAATGTPQHLIAQWLHTKDDAYRVALQLMVDGHRHDAARQVEILKMMMDAKVIEDIDFHRRYPDLIDRVLRSAVPGVPGATPLPSPADADATRATVAAIPAPGKPLDPPVQVRFSTKRS